MDSWAGGITAEGPVHIDGLLTSADAGIAT